MRAFGPVALLLLLTGCGGGSPITPTPIPPAPTFTGTVTNTVTGASVQGFTATISNGRLTVSAPGFVTRETAANRSAVDLIPEAGFDLAFYRQLARNGHEAPGNLEMLRVLASAPAIYLQTDGLSAATIAALEQTARSVVPAFTGGRLTVTTWETGGSDRHASIGWIVVHIVNDTALNCGRSTIGASAGEIWFNLAARCMVETYGPTNLAHELGHALGFWHVDDSTALMFRNAPFGVTSPTALERHHGALAYARTRGNRDVDVD